MQRPTSNVFHDKIDMRFSFIRLVNLGYVFMVHALKQFDFTTNTPLPVDVVELCLVINLDGKLFATFNVNSVLDHSISALT